MLVNVAIVPVFRLQDSVWQESWHRCFYLLKLVQSLRRWLLVHQKQLHEFSNLLAEANLK